MKLRTYKEIQTRIPATGIRRIFESVVEEEGDPEWSSRVNLVVTTDARIRMLNRRFRSQDRATDVLSTRRQAHQYQVTVSQDYLRLFCHGLLHLFGYDHKRKAQARRMEERQDYFLGLLSRERPR
jgi:ssRNA-specific RNase YbeY (16S rRNA maturation enzyme)